MAYAFDDFAKNIKQKPENLPLVISWLEYLSTSFGQRQAKGKSEQEFASVVLTARGEDLPPLMTKFLLKNIYPFLRDDRLKPIHDTLAQLPNPPSSNIAQTLKLLRNIMSLPVTEGAGRHSLFSFFSKKKSAPTQQFDDQTIIATGPAKNVVNKKPTHAMEAVLFQGDIIAESKKNRPIDKQFEALMQGKDDADTIPAGRSMSLMQRLTSRFHDSKVKTILGTHSPLLDVELETLRMQTLVSLNKSGSVLVWRDIPKEDELRSVKPDEFFKLLQMISNRADLTPKARALLNQLKNGLNIRSKLLTDPQIILNIIHEGLRSFQHTIERLSEMTDQAKINKKIGEYLHHIAHTKLLAEADVFRRKFLDCTLSEDLEKLLQQYQPTRNILKKYPNLRFIIAIQKVKAGYDRDPSNLMRTMNKCLGVYGEANIKDKLSKLLLTSDADAVIGKEIIGQSSITDVKNKLAKLQNNLAVAPVAHKLLTFISTFLDQNQHLGFQQFVVSINQFAPAIRQKLTILMRQFIQKELSDRIALLLKSKEPVIQRLNELQKILDNPRYQEPSIQVYGYDVKVMSDKLQSLKPSLDPNLIQVARHILSSAKIPATFLTLVVEGKKAAYRNRSATIKINQSAI